MNDPASAPPIPRWGGGRGNKMIAAYFAKTCLPISSHVTKHHWEFQHYAASCIHGTTFHGMKYVKAALISTQSIFRADRFFDNKILVTRNILFNFTATLSHINEGLSVQSENSSEC